MINLPIYLPYRVCTILLIFLFDPCGQSYMINHSDDNSPYICNDGQLKVLLHRQSFACLSANRKKNKTRVLCQWSLYTVQLWGWGTAVKWSFITTIFYWQFHLLFHYCWKHVPCYTAAIVHSSHMIYSHCGWHMNM